MAAAINKDIGINTGRPRVLGEKEKAVLEGFLRYKLHREKTWDKIARRCEAFYYGDQWSGEHKNKLQEQRRAPSVFNHILPVVDSIVGHQIQNRVDLVAKPVDRFGDVILADILTSIIKNIEWRNGVSLERRFQFLDGIVSGVGVKEIWLENDLDLQNVVRVEQKANRHYYFDPRMEKYDMRDQRKMYKEVWMSREDIELTYGKEVAKKIKMPEKADELPELPVVEAKPTWDASSNDYGNLDNGINDSEFTKKMLEAGYDSEAGLYRVVEEYKKEYERIELFIDPATNTPVRLDEMPEEFRKSMKGLTKTVVKSYIKLTTVIADSVVAVEADIKSKKNQDVEFFHLFNVYFPYWLNGKYWGAVENLLYPQEDINKHYSQIIHILNSYANSGLDYEEGALADPNDEMRLPDLLAQNGTAIKWAEGALTGGKVRPRQPHEAPQTLFTLVAQKGELTRYVSSTPLAFQGNSKRGESGRAREADIGQASMKQLGLIDNFRETQRLEGKAYLYWIQNYYKSEMLIRVVGDEYGRGMQEIMLNMQYFDRIINDVSIGVYDITLEHEQMTQSERQRNLWMLNEMARSNPQYADIISKYQMMLSDTPYKEKILQEWEQRQQMLIQQQQIAMMQGQPGIIRPPINRGPIQTAPRPGSGTRRMPVQMRA